MTRGLLAELGSEAEFAFIMGHEIGHVSARHTARQMSQRIITSAGLIAAGVALSDTEYGGAATTLGAVGSNLLLLKFSRADELEADLLGVQYMQGLGYDPKNAVKAHQSLERAVDKYLKSIGKGSREATFIEELLSTHPRSSERIKEIEGIHAPPASFALKGDGTGAERFKNMVSDLKKTDTAYRRYYDKALSAFIDNNIKKADELATLAIRADGTQPPYHVLKGYIELLQKDYQGAERHFSRALAIDDGYQPGHRGMGTLHYLRKDYSKAIGTLTRALKIFPGDPSARFFLGMSRFRTGKYREAIRNLSPYASARPKDPQVHYYLGESYEKMGEVRRAYDEYVMQVKVSPGNDEGRLAAARLGVLRRLMEEERQLPPPRQ
jgi:predicted Zn-dependent protease